MRFLWSSWVICHGIPREGRKNQKYGACIDSMGDKMRIIDFLTAASRSYARYMELRRKAAGYDGLHAARWTGTPGSHGNCISPVERAAETREQAARLLPHAEKEYKRYKAISEQLKWYYFFNVARRPQYPTPFDLCAAFYVDGDSVDLLARIHGKTPASIKASIKRGLDLMGKAMDPDILECIAAGLLKVDGHNLKEVDPPETLPDK